MNKNIIVIHPNDPSTKFLNVLYDEHSPWNSLLLDETTTNSKLKQVLTANALKDRTVMMLGHGYSKGMFSPQKVRGEFNQFARLIIDSSTVQFLRERECIGIWCHANEFAAQYGLKGLFSGMIISDKDEADMYGIRRFSQKEIEMYNQDFASSLEYCLENFNLKDVPEIMSAFVSAPNELEQFNFGNLFYYE